jgi:hypothetical protein
MLPVAALPDAAFIPLLADGGSSLHFRQRLGKPCLDQSPSRRKIRIGRRQCPHRVQMVGQDHDCRNVERLEHVPQKWKPVLRKGHAETNS